MAHGVEAGVRCYPANVSAKAAGKASAMAAIMAKAAHRMTAHMAAAHRVTARVPAAHVPAAHAATLTGERCGGRHQGAGECEEENAFGQSSAH
jgi:hypothetical protein